MEHSINDNDTNNNNLDRKKTTITSRIYGRFITPIAFPTLLLLLTLISAAPTYPIHATGASNETAVTQAPGGASVGPAGGTNVTPSDCLPQNAATNGSSVVGASGANTTTPNNNTTSTTFAPSGASIGANDTSTLNATAGNTAGNITGNTSTTFAPSGASLC